MCTFLKDVDIQRAESQFTGPMYLMQYQVTRRSSLRSSFSILLNVIEPRVHAASSSFRPSKALAHLAIWILINGLIFLLSSPLAVFPSNSTGGSCTLFLPISCAPSWAQSSVCTAFSPDVASKSARSFDSSYAGGSGLCVFVLRCRRKSKVAIAMSATTPTPPSDAPTMSGR